MAASMNYNAAAGLSGMLKQGTKHYDDRDVVLRNIDACQQIARMLQTCVGPQGRHKLVVNHLGKTIITADCAAILKEIPVEHPAGVLLTQACQQQANEFGDATGLVVAVAGALLGETATLISKMTWQTGPEILAGYRKAIELITAQYLPSLVCRTVESDADWHDVVRPVLSSKQYGCEPILTPLVVEACQKVRDADTGRIPVEMVRTMGIPGGNLEDSVLVHGFVARRAVESTVTSAKDCKIVVFAAGVEAATTEAKGTVVLKSAEELTSYSKSEEEALSQQIGAIAASGVKVVVSGGNVSDMAMHFLNAHKMVVLRLGSKWEIRRLCQAVGATALVRLGAPTPDEMGHAKVVEQRQLGFSAVTVFEGEEKLTTLVLRASTTGLLQDLERAVDDGVQALAQVSKDGRLVYGGGGVEMALAQKLKRETTVGLESYAFGAMANALLVIPRTLAENAGHDATAVVADLQATHASAEADTICDVGIDVDENGNGLASMKDKKICDVLSTKMSALKLAVDVTVTILSIDQLIMSKPAGGPKPQ